MKKIFLNKKLILYFIFSILLFFSSVSLLFADNDNEYNYWSNLLATISISTNNITDIKSLEETLNLANINIGFRFDINLLNNNYNFLNNIYFGNIFTPKFYYKTVSLEGYNYDWYLDIKDEFYMGLPLFRNINKIDSVFSRLGIYISFGIAARIHITNNIVYTYDSATSSMIATISPDNNGNHLIAMSIFSNIGLNYTLTFGCWTIMIDLKYLLSNMPGISMQIPAVDISKFEISLSLGVAILN